MEKQLYTTQQAATLLGVHTNTVRNMVNDGRLNAIKTRGNTGSFRFRHSDLEAFLENPSNPGITVSEQKLVVQTELATDLRDELSFLMDCGNPYRIFGSYLETLSATDYSHALRGKSAIWVQETYRQIRLRYPQSSLSKRYDLNSFLSHVSVGISGMRRADGKVVITSFLIYTDKDGQLIIDGTLQQFHSNLKPGIAKITPSVAKRYYKGIETMPEASFNAAVMDRNAAYFKQYLQKLF